MFNGGGMVGSQAEPWHPSRAASVCSGVVGSAPGPGAPQAAKSLEERELKSCPGSTSHLH